MFRSISRLVLLVSVPVLAACGFQFQGGSGWPEDWTRYQLEYSFRDPQVAPFVDALDEALRHRSLEPGTQHAFRIWIRELTDSKIVAAIGGDGKAVEFELQRRLRFQLQAGNWLSDVYELAANRRLSFDPALVLAKEAEEEGMRRALSRDLIEMLILRTEADLRLLAERVPAP